MNLSSVQELKNNLDNSGQPFESILVFKKANTRVARNGADFLMVELGDKSGSFAVTCFSDTPSFNFFSQTKEDSVVHIIGSIDSYQGRFSPKIDQARTVEDNELQQLDILHQLVETSLESPDTLWQELQDFINSINHQGLKDTVTAVFDEIEDSFKSSSAAIAMHHAYRHGLLEHTVHVARAGAALLPLYPEVNADLALAGILVHDVGKVIEYEGAMTTKKSRTGILQGHVVLGYRMTRKAGIQSKLHPDLLERLEHIVLSHQGELEWGAAAMAATPEAVFVSMVDNLDAKMGMVQYALRHKNPNEPFSAYLPGLKSNLLTSPIQDGTQ